MGYFRIPFPYLCIYVRTVSSSLYGVGYLEHDGKNWLNT
jgi:hypothetical protein